MVRRRSEIITALTILLAACSSAPVSPTAHSSSPGSVAASPTELPTATPTLPTPTSGQPSPTPPAEEFVILPSSAPVGYEEQIHCTGDIGANDPVAIVALRAKDADAPNDTVLRDYADPDHPRTACTFGAGLEPYDTHLIDARHVVTSACTDGSCRHAVVDLPEVRYHWFALPGQGADLVAVSPGLDEVAWISTKADGTGRRLHLTRADGDHVVARLRDVGGRCGSPDDSKLGDYTHSGEMLYVLDVPIANDAVFLVFAGLDRAFGLRPPAGGWEYPNQPAMPIWTPNGDALFFRSEGKGWRWTRDGGRQTFLPAHDWRYPTITPNGEYLAYALQRPDGFHDLYLLNLGSGGAPVRIARKATTPVFLNDDQLWLMREAQGVCGNGAAGPAIYEISSGDTSGSIVLGVESVWPATSSNY
jgi:hypothetical protein